MVTEGEVVRAFPRKRLSSYHPFLPLALTKSHSRSTRRALQMRTSAEGANVVSKAALTQALQPMTAGREIGAHLSLPELCPACSYSASAPQRPSGCGEAALDGTGTGARGRVPFSCFMYLISLLFYNIYTVFRQLRMRQCVCLDCVCLTEKRLQRRLYRKTGFTFILSLLWAQNRGSKSSI